MSGPVGIPAIHGREEVKDTISSLLNPSTALADLGSILVDIPSMLLSLF